MNVGMYQAIGGMKAMWDQQQVIASNMSRNVVPGTKISQPFFEVEKTQAGDATTPENLNGLNSSPVRTKVYTDFSQGSISPTQNPYNLAIQGEAFFGVQGKDGSVHYTRNGDFALNAEGKLLQTDGTELLGEGGPIQVPTETKELRITGEGSVFSDGNEIGKISLTRFENPSKDLEVAADGRFKLVAGKQALPGLGPDDQVQQGFLEQSNANSIKQMIQMMEVNRAYQAQEKALKVHDDLNGRVIQVAV